MEGDERAGEGSKGNDRMEETKKKRREGKSGLGPSLQGV